MAISLEFINFVVPISVIREKYPGGWEQCVKDHSALMGGRVWHDEHLLRDGAMNPNDIQSLVDEWRALGFEPTQIIDGIEHFKDICVIESIFGRPTLPCDWIEIDYDDEIGKDFAYLKNTEPGVIANRDTFANQQIDQ